MPTREPRTPAEALPSLRQTIASRNTREWVACALAAAAFGWYGATTESLWARAFSAEIVLAAAFIAFRLYREGRVRLASSDAEQDGFDARYVEELRRHARLLLTAPFWYVLPLGVGVIGLSMESVVEKPFDPISIAIVVLLVSVMSSIALASRRAGRLLANRADAVEEGEGDPGPFAPSAKMDQVTLFVFGLMSVMAIAIVAYTLLG